MDVYRNIKALNIFEINVSLPFEAFAARYSTLLVYFLQTLETSKKSSYLTVLNYFVTTAWIVEILTNLSLFNSCCSLINRKRNPVAHDQVGHVSDLVPMPIR